MTRINPDCGLDAALSLRVVCVRFSGIDMVQNANYLGYPCTFTIMGSSLTASNMSLKSILCQWGN